LTAAEGWSKARWNERQQAPSIVMTTTTKLLLGVIIGLVGAVGYLAERNRDLVARVAAVPAQTKSAPVRAPSDSEEKQRLIDQLEAAQKENQALRRVAEGKAVQTDDIAGRVGALKDAMQRLPEQQIPLLPYATEADWYAAVDGQLETEKDFRVAMARIRGAAEMRFAKLLQPALKAYLTANGGNFPKEAGQLQAFFGQGVEAAAWRHFRIARADEIKNVRMGGEWIITQAVVIDSEFDSRMVIGPRGFGTMGGTRR
jgi:hypothetical protein